MIRHTKILVVDDEPQNAEIMREILSFHPRYEYKVATSGEQALELLEAFYPDIILLDIMMPGIDGYEVCRRIREGKRHKLSKIVMVSGRSMVGDRLKGYSAGADDYITKPFVEDELLAKIDVFSKLNRMEEVDNMKTMALNILSHETRTPLNGIVLGSELLGDMDGLPDLAKKYINMVRESGSRIQDLVEKISRYCTVKGGLQLSLSKNRIDQRLLHVVEKSPSVLAERIQYDFDGELLFYADWALLEEVLLTLLDNAMKYSPQATPILVEYRNENSVIRISVKDEGSGIDPSLSERIFDGLYSSDLLHHRHGSGLSLAIAKEIVEEHGGTIYCRNRKSCGSVFELTLKAFSIS